MAQNLMVAVATGIVMLTAPLTAVAQSQSSCLKLNPTQFSVATKTGEIIGPAIELFIQESPTLRRILAGRCICMDCERLPVDSPTRNTRDCCPVPAPTGFQHGSPSVTGGSQGGVGQSCGLIDINTGRAASSAGPGVKPRGCSPGLLCLNGSCQRPPQ